LVAALVLFLLAGCSGGFGKVAWEGVYVSHAQSEYSVADDTLKVSLAKDGQYEVVRSTGFCPVRDGKLLPKRFRSEHFTMVLDASGKVLTELLNGRVYSTDSGGGLVVGKVVYRRLN